METAGYYGNIDYKHMNNIGIISRRETQLNFTLSALNHRRSTQHPNMEDKYQFFYAISPLSQSYRCQFQVKDELYFCVEQALEYEKAKLFQDNAMATQILQTTSPSACEQFGKQIKGFDEDIWDKNRRRVMFEANLAKFSQNEAMKDFLLGTGNRVLVEANPGDQIWGVSRSRGFIVLKEDIAKWTAEKEWLGLNLLGKSLMKVRETLRDRENHSKNY